MSQPPVVQGGREDDKPSIFMPMFVYLAYLAFFVAGIGMVVGVIFAYVSRGTGPAWIESHYQYQIRTFWIGLLYSVIGCVLWIFLVGWLILLAAAVWLILRCARGLSWLNQGVAVPDPKTWAI